jgi:predicted HAD superfamily phosphohydrolase YqeG
MSFLEATGDFCKLTPFDFNANLVTVDAENVLTDYGNPNIRPEALDLLKQTIGRNCVKIVVATNNKDQDYIDELKDQLFDLEIPVLSGLEYANKKTSADMFLGALAISDGVEPKNALHIDDQLLSFVGARMAGFGRGILVKPYGSNAHRGVKIGRVIDTPLRVGFRTFNAIREFRTDGIDG